jgi:hypothetical protein
LTDNGVSILQATYNAKLAAVLRDDTISIHLFKEVISHLEYAGAVPDPTSLEERGFGRQISPRLDTANAVHNPLHNSTPQMPLIPTNCNTNEVVIHEGFGL